MNYKKEVAPLWTRKGSIYQKGTNQIFKISRSKFSNFIDCPRCFFGETNPIIDKKINKIEKGYVSDFKKQLKKTKDKNEQEEFMEFIKLYEKPTDIV
jgi:hypothetical protein